MNLFCQKKKGQNTGYTDYEIIRRVHFSPLSASPLLQNYSPLLMKLNLDIRDEKEDQTYKKFG